MSSAYIRHTAPPIGSQRFVLAARFRLWGHFVLTDGSRLAGTDLSDAIVEASIREIMRMF